MSRIDPSHKLRELLALPSETEWAEFKEAKNNYGFEEIGRYFSALGNEANLHSKDAGWLVFGVTDKYPRQLCGTKYRETPPGLDKLKIEIAKHTNHQITFHDIFDFEESGKRIVLFQIPPAPRGIPLTWKGIAYGRCHDSLGVLNLQEIETIRGQKAQHDWSASICPDATLKNLNSEAIIFAREQYKIKQPHLAEEIDSWSDIIFLNKSRVCIEGRITNTALILLGNPESAFHLSPALAQITWVLRDNEGLDLDYHHYNPPLILAVDHILGRIRNLTVRVMPSGTLFPMEITQYDPWVLRECLHNCIAHQDYSKSGRVSVVEGSESILFSNLGDFLPGSVENVIRSETPPSQYRNTFLSRAMVSLNMIDTIGSGIRRMFLSQQKRFFPMPDYSLDDDEAVKVRVYGKIIDEKYTKILMDNSKITLTEAIALDKVQKKKNILDDEIRWLRKRKLVEGRKPNIFVSARIAEALGEEPTYIKNLALSKQQYKDYVLSYLAKFKTAKRKKINELLIDMLSNRLDRKQKLAFIKNLLQEMKRDNLIESTGVTRSAMWRLAQTGEKKIC